MTHRARVAAFLASAVLSGCALYATFAPATAGPTLSVEPPAADAAIQPHARVYLFRGFAGLVFSRGMDRLAELIEQAGLKATVNEAVMCSSMAQEAIDDYRKDAAPIVAIGHSMGAACALSFAGMLDADKIPVSLVVTTDPAKIADDLPLNVERYINIFQSNSILGGRDVKPKQGFAGNYASFDLAKHADINHLNIEKNSSIHEQILSKILLLGATPAKTDSEAMPIRYVVPAEATLELWDSGMPVFAHPGDTLEAVAMRYEVPLWSLAQVNPAANGALAAGQRIIVPRHLLPLIATNGGIVTGQTQLKH